MTAATPKRGPGRPPNPRPDTADIRAAGGEVDERLHALIQKGVGAMEVAMDTLAHASPSDEDIARIVELTAKASEIRGQVVRADAHLTRRKLTLPQIEKGIAALTPDERATLLDRLGVTAGGNALG